MDAVRYSCNEGFGRLIFCNMNNSTFIKTQLLGGKKVYFITSSLDRFDCVWWNTSTLQWRTSFRALARINFSKIILTFELMLLYTSNLDQNTGNLVVCTSLHIIWADFILMDKRFNEIQR